VNKATLRNGGTRWESISPHPGKSETNFRHALLATALFAGLCLLPVRIAAQQVRLLVQSSPLAGFNFHQAPDVWQGMRVGDALTLEREPDNVHDGGAISVQWRGHKLGYVPRAQNAALAWAMDRGETLHARVSRLQPHRNPRKRIEFEVYVE
jgi:hypothetical protein